MPDRKQARLHIPKPAAEILFASLKFFSDRDVDLHHTCKRQIDRIMAINAWGVALEHSSRKSGFQEVPGFHPAYSPAVAASAACHRSAM
jgi:hypothetical protein